MFLKKLFSRLFKKQSYTDSLNLEEETYNKVYLEVLKKEKELGKQLREKIDNLKDELLD